MPTGSNYHEVPFLRPCQRQGGGFARKQRSRFHPPAAGVSEVRKAVHDLRTNRRDSLHGGKERRAAREIRSPEGSEWIASCLREAASADQQTGADRERGGGLCDRICGAGAQDQ